jgi:hypothetical protein
MIKENLGKKSKIPSKKNLKKWSDENGEAVIFIRITLK